MCGMGTIVYPGVELYSKAQNRPDSRIGCPLSQECEAWTITNLLVSEPTLDSAKNSYNLRVDATYSAIHSYFYLQRDMSRWSQSGEMIPPRILVRITGDMPHVATKRPPCILISILSRLSAMVQLIPQCALIWTYFGDWNLILQFHGCSRNFYHLSKNQNNWILGVREGCSRI